MKKVTYPGTDNNTLLLYDPLGRCVKITETVSGSVTSTKQFVWCDAQRCEERDGSGALSDGKQFYGLGQVNYASGTPTNYFYNLDHLGSVREMTKTVSGTTTIEAQYAYGPWGEVTKLTGSADSDFQYAGYYKHARSGLNLTLYRAYNPGLGRWISRDPLGEEGEDDSDDDGTVSNLNLYSFCNNSPVNFRDLDGLLPIGPGGTPPQVPRIAGGSQKRDGDDNKNKDPEKGKGNKPRSSCNPAPEPGSGGRPSGNKLNISFGHGARHAEELGINPRLVESRIRQDLQSQAQSGAEFRGSFWGRTEVEGHNFEYRGHIRNDGTVNIGTYYGPHN